MSEIALYNRIQDPIAAVAALAKPFTLMFGLNNEAQGTFLAFACFAENKTPFDIVKTYDIVSGRLRKKALAIFAEFRALGGKVRWIETGNDGKRATAEFTFEGQVITESFTIEQAKAQGLVRKDSNWEKTPGNMLRARVLSNAIAMLAPEIVAGTSGNPEDDADDLPPEKPLLPAKEPKVKPAQVDAVRTVEKPVDEGRNIEHHDAPVNQESAPTPAATKTKPVVNNWASAKDPGKVSTEGADALMKLIPEKDQAKALEWMEKQNWIPPLGGIKDLSPARAQKIYKAPEQFIEHISKNA